MKSTNIVIVHDAEPDDLLAISLLARQHLNIKKTYVLDKADQDVSYSRAKFAQQHHACVPYQTNELVVCTTSADLVSHLKSDPEFATCLVIWLCTFEPLYLLYQERPDLVKTMLVSAYGSVNLRWCYNKLTDPTPFVDMINHGFAALHVFETFFAFGEANSANSETAPELTQLLLSADNSELSAKNSDLRVIFHAMKGWNEYMSRWLETAPKTPTNLKIIDNLANAGEVQMVCADFALACVLSGDGWQRVKASVVNGFIKLEDAVDETTLRYWTKKIVVRDIDVMLGQIIAEDKIEKLGVTSGKRYFKTLLEQGRSNEFVCSEIQRLASKSMICHVVYNDLLDVILPSDAVEIKQCVQIVLNTVQPSPW